MRVMVLQVCTVSGQAGGGFPIGHRTDSKRSAVQLVEHTCCLSRLLEELVVDCQCCTEGINK